MHGQRFVPARLPVAQMVRGVLRGAAQSCRCSRQTGFILNLPPGTHGRYCKPPFIMREYILCGAWADCLMRQRCASGSNRGGYPIDYQGSSRQSTWSRIRVGFRRLPFTPPVAFSGRTYRRATAPRMIAIRLPPRRQHRQPSMVSCSGAMIGIGHRGVRIVSSRIRHQGVCLYGRSR